MDTPTSTTSPQDKTVPPRDTASSTATQAGRSPKFPKHAQDQDNPKHPRNRPCGHPLHPGIHDYFREQCALCRMHWAIDDVQKQQDRIISKGGMEQWRKNTRKGEERRDRIRTCEGPGQKNKFPPSYNIYAENTSFRSAKVRLYNLANELKEHERQEDGWEKLRPLLVSTKKKRMEHSATKALDLYTDAVEQGTMTKVQLQSALIGHKRGREYEAIADTDYPAGEEVEYPKRTVDPYYGANVAQSKFIHAYAKEDESSTTSAIEPPPKRRRRDTGAKVSFNEESYVRDEADIDNLRWEYGDERRSVKGRSASMPLRRSILCTVEVKNDSRPRRSHFVRPLKYHSRGTGRRYFKRRDKTYTPNDWTLSDSDQVCTSGVAFSHEIWDQYIDYLEFTGGELDMLMGRSEASDDEETISNDEEMSDDEEDQVEESQLLEQQDDVPLAQDTIGVWPYVEVKGLKEAVQEFPRARLKYS